MLSLDKTYAAIQVYTEFDESELEDDNLVELSEDELENEYSDESEEDYYTNILDEDNIPDDKIFEDLNSKNEEDED